MKQELDRRRIRCQRLDNAVVTTSGPDVSAETLKANSSLSAARKAYQAGDYSAARAHLGSCSPPWPRLTGS